MQYLTIFSLFTLLFLSTACKESFYSNPIPDNLGPQAGQGQDGTQDTDPSNSSDPNDPNDPSNPLVPYIQYDAFIGSNLQKLDVLLVIDNSGSMNEEIAAVKNQLGNFVARMQARQAVDYQIAVTTTNYIGQTRAGASRLQASTQTGTVGKTLVKSASDADPVQIGRDILTSIPQNPAYAGYEMGILAAKDTIENAGSSFMRSQTDLAVITVSDEDDHSEPACIDPNSAACAAYTMTDYVCPAADSSCPYWSLNDAKNFFQGLGRSVMYKPLVGILSEPCSTVATYGKRYSALTELLGFTNGAGNICTTAPSSSTMSPLETNLLAIADSISRRGICFNLSKKATGNDIDVYVNNNAVAPGANGYTFDKPTNAICFSDQIILNNSKVEVSYESLK